MTAKVTVELAQAVLASVDKNLIDPSTGGFYPVDVTKDIQAVTDVETALKTAGIVVPVKVDKAIAIAKSVLELWGA
jgi:hypothetical protein